MPTDTKSSILNLRIAKKAYVFDQKKRYEHTGKFTLKRESGGKPELNDVIDTFLGKRKEFGSEQPIKQQPQKEKPSTKKPSSAFGTAIKTMLALILLFALILLYIVVTAGGAAPSQTVQAQVPRFGGDFSFSVADSMVVSSGSEEKPTNTARFLITYSTQNISSLSIYLRLSSTAPQQQVYILRSRRDSAESYPEFLSTLRDSLAAKGLSLNEVDVQALQSIPGGSTIIVPTGYLPASLLLSQPRTLMDIVREGNTIIYIGLPFDKTVLNENGQPVSVSQADLNKLGINFTFTRSKPASTSGFDLFDAQYVVGNERVFGSVSMLRAGDGQLLFLPQSLDGGWRGNGAAAGEDIALLVSSAPWYSSFADARLNVSTLQNSSGMLAIYSGEFTQDEGFAYFYAEATDLDGLTQGTVRSAPVKKLQRGDLYVTYEGAPPPPSSVSNEKVRTTVILREQSTTPVKLNVNTISGQRVIKSDPLEPDATVPTLTRFFDYNPDVPPGTYVLSVEDSGGKQYAAGLITVGDIDIIPTSIDWKSGAFTFGISSGGKPVTARKITASVDGKYAGEFSLASSVQLNVPNLQPGTHVFSFQLADMQKDVQLEYSRSRAFYENPLAIFLGILALVIFSIGYFLRLPDKVVFGLDVPDFPPLSAIKIPVRRSTVLEMFEQVNKDYSWENMPLTLDEIKNGFRKLTYNGKPILIGDYNLERILAKLESEGHITHVLSYYLLTQWEKKSARSAFYLCAYRRMRDTFIANTVRFSKIGSQKDCDVKITLASKDGFVHIFEDASALSRALRTASLGTTLVVFKDDSALSLFEDSLHTASKLHVAFKMEIDSGQILLLTLAQLGDYLKGMRPA
ncbi:Uncharacterised protein [Candidatus Anstonella stagnisolia]|nr:Uncharacterised protein [Candidatus Anstonella stagnisolia]